MRDRNYLLSKLLLVGLTITPVLLGYSRDPILDLKAKGSDIKIIEPSSSSPKSCSEDVCVRTFLFTINTSILARYKSPFLGYHSASLDSYVKIDNNPFNEVANRNELHLSWFKFKTYAVFIPNQNSNILQTETTPSISDQSRNIFDSTPKSPAEHSVKNDHTIEVVCLSPVGTKKLGMENPKIFFGSKDDIESLQATFSFFNVHLYIIAAILAIIFGVSLCLSEPVQKKGDEQKILFQSVIVFLALAGFSHYFDNDFISLGIPRTFVEGFVRIIFGVVVSIFFLDGKKQKTALIVYFIFILPCLFDSPLKDFFLHTLYRWVFLSYTLILCSAIIKGKTNLLFSAFAILAIKDTLTLHNILPLTSGLYMFPLGLPGVLVLANSAYLQKIIENQIFLARTKEIGRLIDRLRTVGDGTDADWENLFRKLTRSLNSATKATKISICYLRPNGTVTFSFNSHVFKSYKDGKIPRKFSRVIQTKTPMWWVNAKTLSEIGPISDSTNSSHYNTDMACLIPIVGGGKVFGAIAFTDFSNYTELFGNRERQTEIEGIIGRYLDFLTSWLMKFAHDNSIGRQRLSNDLITFFTSKSAVCTTRTQTIESFLDAIDHLFPCKSLYFRFDPDNERRLHLVASKNLSEAEVETWSRIPFRARENNKHSPFAICINDRIPVYLPDITNLSNLLIPESLKVFQLSNARTFCSLPVLLGDKVLGLITLLDSNLHSESLKSAELMMSTPLTCLAYRLEQMTEHEELGKKEYLLSKLVSADLMTSLKQSLDQEKQLAIGKVEHTFIIAHGKRRSASDGLDVSDPRNYAERLSLQFSVYRNILSEYKGHLEDLKWDGLASIIPASRDKQEVPLEVCMQYLSQILQTSSNEKHSLGSNVIIFHRGDLFRGLLSSKQRLATEICGNELVNAIELKRALSDSNTDAVLGISSQFLFHLRPEYEMMLAACTLGTLEVKHTRITLALYSLNGIRSIFESIKALQARGLTSGSFGTKN
jgi:hypothetical protein